MVAPVVSANATEALGALGPWGAADSDSTGWALLRVLDAILGASQLQDVDDWARDDPATGAPGWSSWMDPALAPSVALPWLAQFVGVVLSANLTDAQQRSAIQQMQGFQRGTPAAMIAAAQLHLTGTKTVVLTERSTDAYHLKVTTYLAETPTPDAVLAALLTLKPAGIVLTYVVQEGLSWAGATGTWATHPETWGSLSTEVGG